jgi:hypothetical protein
VPRREEHGRRAAPRHRPRRPRRRHDLDRGESEPGGFDLYSGGPGDDTIEAIDGERERILCGPGFGHVSVDELDEWQSPECERAHGPGAR